MYAECKDCINQDDCYIWYIVERTGDACPCKITEEDLETKKMAIYEIVYDDRVLHTLSSNNPQTDINMTNLMLKLSDENVGVFTLYRVEIDPETGREKHTQVASTKNGVEI